MNPLKNSSVRTAAQLIARATALLIVVSSIGITYGTKNVFAAVHVSRDVLRAKEANQIAYSPLIPSPNEAPKDWNISLCTIELPDLIKGAHASFSINYSFEVNENGIPRNIKKLLDKYVGPERVSTCVSQWKLRGVPTNTQMVMFFRWEHRIGLRKLSLVGPDFSHVINVEEPSTNVPEQALDAEKPLQAELDGIKSVTSSRSQHVEGMPIALHGNVGNGSTLSEEYSLLAAANPQRIQLQHQLRVAQAVVPPYPLLALHSHTSGETIVEVKVNSTGSVTSAVPVTGPPALLGRSLFAARRWKFDSSAGPLPFRIARLTFVYRLVASGTPQENLGAIFKAPHHLEIVAALPDERPRPHAPLTIKPF